MTVTRARVLAAALLGLLAFLVTVAEQRWVGGMTVYAQDVREARQVVYDAVLANRPPDGKTWEEIGARGTNKRVGAVWLVEAVHRGLGIPVARALFLVDTLALWGVLLLLYTLLRQWVDPPYSLIGVLFLCAFLPLTYLFSFFHPWDRIAQLVWVVILLCIKRGWFAGVALMIAIGTTVKLDIAFAPLLYWLANAGGPDRGRVALRATALGIIAIVVAVVLFSAYPGGASSPIGPATIAASVGFNLGNVRQFAYTHPALLVHALPALLAVAGWPRADRVARAAVVFGAFCLVPFWFVSSYFHEVRGQVSLTFLLLPAALVGLQRLVETGWPGAPRAAHGGDRLP